ncbi:MAG: hypothetical protein AAGH89_07830, partial [Verrucomicrobiota bacterium]
EVELSAEGSHDPDGDELFIKWWHYREAGTCEGDVSIASSDAEKTSVRIPGDAESGDQIHIILELRDHEQEMASPESDENIPLTDYRRVVLNVK